MIRAMLVGVSACAVWMADAAKFEQMDCSKVSLNGIKGWGNGSALECDCQRTNGGVGIMPHDDMVDSVNPMIGAITYAETGMRGDEKIHGFGKTFPGAATPFGMVQLSPDTITGGDNGSGYSYSHKTIEGFSFLHLSGVGWYGEFGNLQVMPTTGPRNLDRERAASSFSHAEEDAKAGYYKVRLTRYGIMAELTALRTTGFLRFTYPKGANARVQFDLARRIGQKNRWLSFSEQHAEAIGDRVVEGWMKCPCEDGGWGRGDGKVSYTVYFYAEFSAPFKESGVFSHDEHNKMFYAEFGELECPLTLSAGISFESVADARGNFNKEADGVSFDTAHERARRLWADALSGVRVEGGTACERSVFATALYHALLDPREVGRGAGFTRRTVFSGWDVFRSEFPLLTIVRPDVVSDTISSMMETVTSGKRRTLPRWDILGCESGCMLGQPIISVMADAYAKGIRNFDGEKALELAIRTLESEGNDRRLGYTPDSLSHTLEYAYADWCCGRLAEMQGRQDIAKRYFAYSKSYTNCWSREVGWMRARRSDGGWLAWEGREKMGQGCVESNPWQQGWFVPHDPDGLISLMGGRQKFTSELEMFFAAVSDDFRWNSAYNHANEPCHMLPFLFDLSDRPGLAGVWTRRICKNAYGTGHMGLCGNEDVGQMSAWYVLAAIGLHPICPGDGRWYLTAPVFEKIVIDLGRSGGDGKAFTILAPGAGRGRTKVRKVFLNGQPLDRSWISHDELISSGTLEFEFFKGET